MVIQKQKYSGEEGQNCAVDVDFLTETVDFRKVGHISNLALAHQEGMTSSVYFLFFSLIPIIMIQWLATHIAEIWFYQLIIALLTIVYLSTFVKALSKTWQKNVLTKKYTWFPHNAKRKKWVKVNPKAIINKQLVLNDSFTNVVLEYKINGDYKKYLNHISIQETFIDTPYQETWFAIFKFSKKPIDGEMWLYWK